MIDWVHQRCKSWGRQVRYIYLGKAGWPPSTVLDKMIKEGILGASSSLFTQHFPECLGEEEIATGNGIKRLNERDREILFIIYVVGERPKLIMRAFHLERTAYYDWVDEVHKRLSASLILKSEQNSEKCRRNPAQDFDNVQAA